MSSNIKKVFVFGAGCIGAEILRRLRLFLPQISPNTEVVVVDCDIVSSSDWKTEDYYLWEAGLYKVEALYRRYRDFMRLIAIPEPVNKLTLPEIFMRDWIQSDFHVISAVDHSLTASQIYFWLRENAPRTEDICWSYQLVKADENKASSLLWGYRNGNPLVEVEPHQIDVTLKDPGKVIGRLYDGLRSIGMPSENKPEIPASMVFEAANNALIQLDNFYKSGIIIPELVSVGLERTGETKQLLL